MKISNIVLLGLVSACASDPCKLVCEEYKLEWVYKYNFTAKDYIPHYEPVCVRSHYEQDLSNEKVCKKVESI